MTATSSIVYLSAHARDVPDAVRALAEARGMRVIRVDGGADVMNVVNRSMPTCLVLDAGESETVRDLCVALKREPYSAIIPVVLYSSSDDPDIVLEGLKAGADEVFGPAVGVEEQRVRIELTLRRADRDVSVHPTTRLPGTVQIERDIADRMKRGEAFAVCYADIDHFKEFNDRYGYTEGDRVILIVSRILRDVVRAYAPTGFIGHIGGDDYIFVVPLESAAACCEEIIEIFDELMPFNYSKDDRERRYFLGKDRRGNVYRVPLMSLSIGVVTNEKRVFEHTARVGELASEMKAYAKTLPGSVFAIDRRHDDRAASDDVPERRSGAFGVGS
ncbi:MAG TPA: diguanylate cyclase [Longimicrobiales bacterium]|nr:diguanylate cyclase [Longimicrobiales bacterium]